jgi:site-specific recombinase XerD
MNALVTAHDIARDIEEFLRFKRAMGIRYCRGEVILNGFRRFIAEHWGARNPVDLDEAVRQWVSRIDGRKAVTVSHELGVVRQLCLYRRRRDPSSYVPEHALAPVKDSVFVPYIFTHDEVVRLVSAASAHHGRSIWGRMLRTLILVLYCTGLRLGEAVRLRTQDVDLQRCTFVVHHSKGRSRIVPFRADLADELRRYAAARCQLVSEQDDDPPAFFLRLHAKPLTASSAAEAIRRRLRQLGIKPPSGRIGARPYEFRHAFAVHRLTAWAVAGEDVHVRLPWLSAYLGHQNLLGTEVYLKATPQLLELASERFEQHLRRSRRSR